MALNTIYFQTFWSKYRVIISGLFFAVITAISPFLVGSSHTWNVKAIIIGACLAISSFIAKDQRGKTITMIGQAFAGLAAYASVYEGHLDVFRLLSCIVIAIIAIPIPSPKPSTYEHSPTIVQANIEAKEIAEIRKANSEANVKDLNGKNS